MCRKIVGLASVLLVVAISLGRPFLAGANQAPMFGPAGIVLDTEAAPPASLQAAGFTLVAGKTGPQLALMQPQTALLASLRDQEKIEVAIPLRGLQGPFTISAEVDLLAEGAAVASLAVDQAVTRKELTPGARVRLEAVGEGSGRENMLRLQFQARTGSVAIYLRHLQLRQGQKMVPVQVNLRRPDPAHCPPTALSPLRQAIELALIEWDWRMQDGIGTERKPSTYQKAIELTLQRGDDLLRDLQEAGVGLAELTGKWGKLRSRFAELARQPAVDDSQWEGLWKEVHALRRRMVLSNPLANTGPIVFVKHVPTKFSHQLTQYLGRFARPGGGIFVLDNPGQSMRARQLVGPNQEAILTGKKAGLPMGSFQHADVSFDGKRILFSFCAVDKVASSWNENCDRFFNLYEVAADGTGLKQLTEGAYNDFAPRYLPNGQIVFISTRRGGWHRCGGRPGEGCENFTLALAQADGSQPRIISYHETQEWDPAVLEDGRVIFTRWDYVNRHAVFYQQLFAVRPDGTAAANFYGNNTFNPVGIWEAQQVPGSRKVMATAGAHHAMTAGSIILVDGDKVLDGPAALKRLTPNALFPESEVRVPPTGWHAPVGVAQPLAVPEQAQRWPGHCYRSPYPLSEKYFLAAYSFDSLLGEPAANPVNMFGLYLVDHFGNKELLYRDLNVSSIWPMPLKARLKPPALQAVVAPPAPGPEKNEGKFYVQNVHESEPALPPGSIKRLRIIQMVPKSTPGINWPRVGLANASPGNQVLGTVPVEPDGSAYFSAPAGIPLSFQALDENGLAVQIMRSVTYLQPGEVRGCVGCHERRTTASPPGPFSLALNKPPATIEPGPDGSRPMSYPILVQPVLDRHCVRCHNPKQADGKVVLTGELQGAFTASYNALAPRVSYAAWGGRGGDFRIVNSEPISKPGHFGAHGSQLTKLLLGKHHGVALNKEDRERLVTWMDANALFYGTFNHKDQERQKRGERIAGPDHK